MSAILGPSDYVLEVVNLFYTGHIEPQTWLKQLTGTTRSGLILRDVSFEVHSSELIAILGSKGSGKKALLDVIACRTPGTKKGYVLLNGVQVNRRLFQTAGGYVCGNSDEFLQPGLTVHQTLHYEACLSLKIPASVRKIRVRQILSDVALTQVAASCVDDLNASERRRLAIGVQLMKDPVVLLADEPAWSLSPLDTYFILSILSNYAKKYGRIVILTMEKPRSDVFPFLDRVTYLCLGDVVYSGLTKYMIDYFRNIGFSCNECENPLMYYLCLSTVDRRSHEKFIESSNQIGLLVDKFKMEGNALFRGKSIGGGFSNSSIADGVGRGVGSMTPLHALGEPNFFSKLGTLIMRNYASTFLFSFRGLRNVFCQLFMLPFLFFIMWIFYFGMKTNTQHVYVTMNGFVLNTLALTYFTGIWTAMLTFEPYRNRYFQECRDGHYNGPTFILAHSLACLPYVIVTCIIASRIAFQSTGLTEHTDWLLMYCVMMTCYALAQQQTFTVLLVVKNQTMAAALLIAINSLALALGSGTVRALRNLPDWLYYLSYISQPRYSGGFLNKQIFSQYDYEMKSDFQSSFTIRDFGEGCRYLNGTHYLQERYYSNVFGRDDLNLYLNFGICFVFPVASFLINCIAYALPLPLLVKQKFRD